MPISIYFGKFYKMIIEKVKKHSKQKGKGKCVLFDLRLINDIESIALTINSIINNEVGLISLNKYYMRGPGIDESPPSLTSEQIQKVIDEIRRYHLNASPD